jgi:hypothetical protein
LTDIKTDSRINNQIQIHLQIHKQKVLPIDDDTAVNMPYNNNNFQATTYIRNHSTLARIEMVQLLRLLWGPSDGSEQMHDL